MQTIYFVSLGPGDPELITLQSLKCLQKADKIFTPIALAPNGKQSSKASDIMLSLGIKEEQLERYVLPMSKERSGALKVYKEVAEQIIQLKKEYEDLSIAVVAEGDSGFYSSSAYICEHLVEAGLPIKQLAGVPAFIACNALMGKQLVQLEEQLHVIPGQASGEDWERAWQSGNTIVVMKGSLCQDEVKRAMKAHSERDWHYLEFVGQAREYYSQDIEAISERKFPYFCIIISIPPRS